ncbi:MAG: spermidine synthase [Gammaproteobacteria bacterium]|nr:spermidine synthase [Gammaproteobacteria bacterium]
MLLEVMEDTATSLGRLRLLRRLDMQHKRIVFEMRLNELVLMTSAAAATEEALAEVALKMLGEQTRINVLVGGLGLGFTAARALDFANVNQMLVIELLPEVLRWHQTGRVPLGPRLLGDPRCRLKQGDFFALATRQQGFDEDRPGRCFDAILLDIDHNPDWLLAPGHGTFYEADGLQRLGNHLQAEGIFALWSSGSLKSAFLQRLQQRFREVVHREIHEHNAAATHTTTARTLYLGRGFIPD